MGDKYLILGSSGFLGKNIKDYFENTETVPKEINYLDGSNEIDLTDFEQLNDKIKSIKPTKVINCSSFVGGIAYGYRFPAKILHLNSQMILNIYKSCHINKVDMLVNPISNCAYPGALNYYQEDVFWDGKPHESVFNYALTRRLIVALGESYYKEYGFSSANVVLSNMYGPNDHFDEERSHALGALINKIHTAKKEGKSFVDIWGTGLPIREWLYVEDGAKALIKASSLNSGSHFFNIGVNKGISITDLANKIANNLSWDGEFKYNTERPDGAKEKRVDGSLGEKILSWKPETSLDHGLKATIDWYLENQPT
jgi:GDP-L-fucose synthase